MNHTRSVRRDWSIWPPSDTQNTSRPVISSMVMGSNSPTVSTVENRSRSCSCSKPSNVADARSLRNWTRHAGSSQYSMHSRSASRSSSASSSRSSGVRPRLLPNWMVTDDMVGPSSLEQHLGGDSPDLGVDLGHDRPCRVGGSADLPVAVGVVADTGDQEVVDGDRRGGAG